MDGHEAIKWLRAQHLPDVTVKSVFPRHRCVSIFTRFKDEPTVSRNREINPSDQQRQASDGDGLCGRWLISRTWRTGLRHRPMVAAILLGSTFVHGCRSAGSPTPTDPVAAHTRATAGSPTPNGYTTGQNGMTKDSFTPKSAAQNSMTPGLVKSGANSPFQLASTPLVSPDASTSAPPPHLREDEDWLLGELEQKLVPQAAPTQPSALELLDFGLVLDPNVSVHGQPEGTHRPFGGSQLPTDQWQLTQSEMLRIAMSHSPVLRPLGVRVIDNPDGVTTRYDVAIDATDPFLGPQAALAEFDAQLNARITTQNNDRVFNNSILGGAAQELVQDATTVTTGWQQRTHSGATIDFGINHLYDNNNRGGNLFPSYYETQWEAGIRQPLLRGAGRNFNLIAGPDARPGFNFSNGIVIAKLNVKVSEADFQIEVRNFVRDLYQTYWQLHQTFQTFEQVQAAENLAHRTWQTVKAKREASVSGGDANKEAQARARYFAFRRQLRSILDGNGGQSGLYVVERRLRYLMGLPIVDGRLLRPSEDPATARFTFDFEHLVSRAIENRTEINRQSLRLRQEELRLVAAKNFLLPQLDMIGRYRLRGFGDDLAGGGPRFASAYEDFFSFEHQEWEFGVEMGLAAGRRQAKAAVRNATLLVHRERQLLGELRRAIGLEVADAYGEVESSYAGLEASLAQTEAAHERLQASMIQHQADNLPIEFLLDAQEELLRAQTQLAADQMRYTLSLVAIGTSTGSLLQDVGLHITTAGVQRKDLVFAGP